MNRTSRWLLIVAALAVVVAVVAAIITPRVSNIDVKVQAAQAASAAVDAVGNPQDAKPVDDRLTGVLAADYASRGFVAAFPNADGAPAQSTTVIGAATDTVSDGRAKVLVFADQQLAPDAPRLAIARWATMIYDGHHWRLSRLEPVNAQ